MKNIIALAGLSILSLSITSCHKHVLKGEGNIESETRVLQDFSKIEADGSTTVTIVKDTEYKAIVTGYGNIIPVYETKVKGERLVLKYKNGYWNIRNSNITVEVHTPYVDKVSVNGSGNVELQGGFEQDNLTANINGSGTLDVLNNKYRNFNADVNGSGDIRAASAQCNIVDANISGSGTIEVYVLDHLNVDISGSGDVYYQGNPTTNISISGSGSVQKRN